MFPGDLRTPLVVDVGWQDGTGGATLSCSAPSSLAVVSPQEPLSFHIDIAGGVDAQTRRPALLSLSICAHTAAVPPSAVQRHREEAAKGSAAAADGEKPVIALTLCTSSALYGQCVYILFLDLVISLRFCLIFFINEYFCYSLQVRWDAERSAACRRVDRVSLTAWR